MFSIRKRFYQVATSADWKFEHRVLSLAKVGFRREEAEAALNCSATGEVMAHDTLCRLVEPFRPPPIGSEEAAGEHSRKCSSVVRDEEASVLQAIFGQEAFRVRGTDETGLRWDVDVALEFDDGGVITAETVVGVLFQNGRR